MESFLATVEPWHLFIGFVIGHTAGTITAVFARRCGLRGLPRA